MIKDFIDFQTCSFSHNQVLKELSSLPSKFSSGPDNVPPIILKKCSSTLVSPLVLIFNASLSSGKFPVQWKSSYIIPIFKSGDRSNIGDYRGVCIQSAIPKVLDKLITTNLTAASKHFIADQQYGFISRRSTVKNLLCYQYDILESFQQGHAVHSIYTDVAKAFDRVDSRFLLAKLKSYGIEGSFLLWLSDYLKDRTQSVRVGDTISTPIQVLSGVGQDSHIGPLLFTLFFNDLPNFIHHSSLLMYADDVKLYKAIKSPNDCSLLQQDLSSFYNWLTLNGLELSLHKCALMIFSRSICPFNFIYTVNSTPLSPINEVKDLGILCDKKLSFVSHIMNLSMRYHRLLGYVKRNSVGLSSVALCFAF